MEGNNVVEKQEETLSSDEMLKAAAKEAMAKVSRQSMLLGGQSVCKVILDKISTFERTPGNKSNNDHKRLIRDIKYFCEKGLSRKVKADNETEFISNNDSETVQN